MSNIEADYQYTQVNWKKANSMLRALVWIVLSATLAMAQSGNSTISGSIKDPTGAPVPTAKVKIVNEQTGVSSDQETNDEGLYRAGSLVPGVYRLEVEARGFERVVRRPLTVEVGQVISVDLTLQLGKASETVTVVEEAPLIQSQSSNIAQTVNRQMLAGLPLPNRAASSLAALAPGVIMIDPGTGTAENYPVFSVAGGRATKTSCWTGETSPMRWG